MNRSALVAFALVAALFSSAGCRSKHPEGDVPSGHKLCRYCCSTANTECSCAVLNEVPCPDYKSTATLPACAECRACSKTIASDQTCSPP